MNLPSHFLSGGGEEGEVGVCYPAGLCGSQRLILVDFLMAFHLVSPLVFILVFETGPRYVALDSLELTKQIIMVYLFLFLNAALKCVCHHTCLPLFLLRQGHFPVL